MIHSRLSPSSSHRWINCPASVVLEDGFVDEETTHMAEGTLAHALADHLLRDTGKAFTEDVSAEMVEYVSEYVNWVNDTLNSHGAVLYRASEHKVKFSAALGVLDSELPKGEGSGTGDVIAVTDDGTLHIIDLKYGREVVSVVSGSEEPLDAMYNTQLMLYAIGAHWEMGVVFKVSKVCLYIAQPRLGHYDSWCIPIDTMTQLSQLLENPYKRGLNLLANPEDLVEADYKPAPRSCKWCKAQAHCPAILKELLAMVPEIEADLNISISDISCAVPEVDIGTALRVQEYLTNWTDRVLAAAQDFLMQGGTLTNYELKNGRPGPRKWSNTEEVLKILSTKRLPKKLTHAEELKSPTQLEKVLDEKNFDNLQHLITRSEAKKRISKKGAEK